MTKTGVQVLILVSAAREIGRAVIDKNGTKRIRRLSCPYSQHRPCSLDCAVLGATRDHDGIDFIWCRATGSRVVLGMVDPDRIDLEEMKALVDASIWLEQVETESGRRNGAE